MTKYINTLIIIATIILINACTEVPQSIILDPSQIALKDTSYISTTPILETPKNVLMEEFSGVRCQNCPSGNAKTKSLLNANPERIIVVTVHSDFLAAPFNGNQDFRNVNAEKLSAELGPIDTKPSSYINRKLFSGQTKLFISDIDDWEGKVSNELALNVPVKLELETVFVDVEERKFRYRATLSFSESMENLNLGFLLTESYIEATQLDGTVEIEDYEHEFVLRDFITSIYGEAISTTISANTVIIKEFEIDLDDEIYNPDAEWKIDNLELVAFIRAENDEIIQSAKVEL